MEPRQQAQIAETMAAMKDAELAVSEFYTVCANISPQDAELWQDLSKQEANHAQIVAQMEKLFATRPEDFRPGRPFNAVAIRTFIKGIKWNQERALKGALPRRQLIGVARDIESSIIESSFRNIVETQNQEFQELMKQLLDETADHHGKIDKLLKEAQ
ncbi:MAG: hypothetical protein PHU21_04635 [Elusimicrobia bacterium]|nr:hypothetical protein [Elusimicrobiota bacterium]